MVKWTRIFVDNRLGSEEVVVPGTAPTEVCDGQCHMGDCRDSAWRPPWRPLTIVALLETGSNDDRSRPNRRGCQ